MQDIGILDHEVGLERHRHRPAAGLDHVGAEGQVGDEATVHDVPLDPVDTGLCECGAFLTEPREVGGEDRWGDVQRRDHGFLRNTGAPSWPVSRADATREWPPGRLGMTIARGDRFTLTIDRIAAGGDGVGNGPDGRVVFVPASLPGDELTVRVTQAKKRFLRAVAESIDRPAEGRRPPPCRYVEEGCGGCDWQHATPMVQTSLRHSIVVDSLRRLGRLVDVTVTSGPAFDPDNYRTTVRAAVVDGRAGFRAAASHRVVVPEHCRTAHPLVDEILTTGRFPDATEVVIKVGARTGDRLVIVDPTAAGVEVPDGVSLIGRDDLAGEAAASIEEIVAGRRLRISADSFFQARPDGAEALAAAAAEFLADAPDGPLLDAYGGGGLFAVLVAGDRPVVVIESNPSSAGDARHNLAQYGIEARVVEGRVEDWPPEPMTVVIADPARQGLGRMGVDVLTATGAGYLVLVSCDPAAMARDARLLVDAGFVLDEVRVFDLFGHTSHIETVSRFRRPFIR